MTSPQIIAHRINKIAELKNIPRNYGVEIDLRDHNDQIIITHDPFDYADAENFEDYLAEYNHGTLILNIKCERIELRIIELLKKYNIKDYFFLDCSFPMIFTLINQGETNIALRFSEFEGYDTIMNLAGKIKWIWVDCFTKLPINKAIYDRFKDNGFKLCLVSPELQKQEQRIDEYRQSLDNDQIYFDAICTKIYNADKWL
jgi:hypothetical protein